MSFFKKLFGNKKKNKSQNLENTDEGKFMPQSKMPADERFAINFRNNGGKFIYCESIAETSQALENIISENGWQDDRVLIYNSNLESLIKQLQVNPTKKLNDSTYFFTTCENLIADDGSILISSNQISENRLYELPENVIVYATTSQLVNTISDGLSEIKAKNKSKIPTNITTIKCFGLDDNRNESFLNYGRSSKHLYLILQEDL